MREAFGGAMMLNGGCDRETWRRAVAQGRADLVSYAKLLLANPDPPRRSAEDLPLNEPDPDTFYGGGEEGYVDYLTCDETAARGDRRRQRGAAAGHLGPARCCAGRLDASRCPPLPIRPTFPTVDPGRQVSVPGVAPFAVRRPAPRGTVLRNPRGVTFVARM